MELQKLDKLHQLVVEQAPVPIVVFNTDLTIVQANRSAAQSVSVQSLVGRKLEELAPSLAQDQAMVTLLADNSPDSETCTLHDVNREKSASTGNGQWTVISDGRERLGVWFGESSRQHQQLKAISSAASLAEESASRMKSEFIANINHEVRTPMNAIIGYTEMLANSKLGAKEKRFVSIIHKSSMALVSIFNDIMELSKIDSGRLQIMVSSIRLSSIISEVEGLFADLAQEKGLTLRCAIEPNVPETMILDGIRLKQVLQNLVSNAVKFTSQGSVNLTVSGSMADSENKRFNLQITVEDSGIGIAVNDQKNIFELFKLREETIAKRYGGVGLGLTLSSRLVRMMNGRIELFSQEGAGSRFTVFLDDVPLAEHLPSESLAMAHPLSADKEIKVMVVDDVDLIKDVFIDFFQDSPYKVMTATNGEEALAMAAAEQPDIIFMDLNLSGMDGRTITKTLRSRPETRQIPVVVMTGDVLEEDDYKPLFDDFLQKPFRLDGLKDMIQRFARQPAVEPETLFVSSALDREAGSPFRVEYWTDELEERLVSAIRSGCLSEAASLGAALEKTGGQLGLSQLVEMGRELQQHAGEPNILGVERLLARLTGTVHPKQS